MALLRRSDWQSRLSEFVDRQQDRSFAYGQLDCCLFAADAIQAMTGLDLAAEFRGRYSNRKEAYTLLKARTGQASIPALIEALMAENSIPETQPRSAGRGDLALIERGLRHHSLGIVALNGRHLLAPAAEGLLRLPLSRIARAWRIA